MGRVGWLGDAEILLRVPSTSIDPFPLNDRRSSPDHQTGARAPSIGAEPSRLSCFRRFLCGKTSTSLWRCAFLLGCSIGHAGRFMPVGTSRGLHRPGRQMTAECSVHSSDGQTALTYAADRLHGSTTIKGCRPARRRRASEDRPGSRFRHIGIARRHGGHVGKVGKVGSTVGLATSDTTVRRPGSKARSGRATHQRSVEIDDAYASGSSCDLRQSRLGSETNEFGST